MKTAAAGRLEIGTWERPINSEHNFHEAGTTQGLIPETAV